MCIYDKRQSIVNLNVIYIYSLQFYVLNSKETSKIFSKIKSINNFLNHNLRKLNNKKIKQIS